MTPEEAHRLQLSGRYSELLRASVAEQVAARERGDMDGEITWTLSAVRACRFIGRTYEGTAHAAHAVLRAQDRPDRQVECVYAAALMHKTAGRQADAIASLDRAIAMMDAATPDATRAVCLLERAEIAIEAGLVDDARIWLTRGAALVHGLENARLLAWTLYLKALLERPPDDAPLLAGARTIIESMELPELMWQICWRLARSHHAMSAVDLARQQAHRALGLLRVMSEPLAESDVWSFWRLAARRSFLAFIRACFGPEFETEVPVPGEVTEPFDPALLPAFVRESARA